MADPLNDVDELLDLVDDDAAWGTGTSVAVSKEASLSKSSPSPKSTSTTVAGSRISSSTKNRSKHSSAAKNSDNKDSSPPASPNSNSKARSDSPSSGKSPSQRPVPRQALSPRSISQSSLSASSSSFNSSTNSSVSNKSVSEAASPPISPSPTTTPKSSASQSAPPPLVTGSSQSPLTQLLHPSSTTSPLPTPTSESSAPSFDPEAHRVLRRCTVRVSEARGVPKGAAGSYIEVYSDSRVVGCTSVKESTQTPLWGEDLDLVIKPHERVLIFKLFAMDSKLRNKDKTIPQTRARGSSIKTMPVNVNIPSTNVTTPNAPKGFSPPKFISEALIEFSAIDLSHSEENWYSTSIDKGKGKDRKVVEGCDIRLSLKFSEILVLPVARYERLIKLTLEDPDFEILRAMCTTEAANQPFHRNAIAEHLVHMSDAKGNSAALLAALASDEIAKTTEKEVLFRGNSIITKAIEYYQKLIGFGWLSSLQPVITEIVVDDSTCELTQSKLTPDDDIKKNFAKLWYYVDEVFNTLERSKESCPSTLRTIYKSIFDSSKKHFAGDDDVMFTAVSGFLFLRYFVPAVMTPKLFRMMDDFAEGNANRSLMLVAMTLQKLGNLLEFEPREAFMDKMNPWLKKKLIVFKNLITFVSTESSEAPKGPQLEDHDLIGHFASLLRIIESYMSVFVESKNPKYGEFCSAFDELKADLSASESKIEELKAKALAEAQAEAEVRAAAEGASNPLSTSGGKKQTDSDDESKSMKKHLRKRSSKGIMKASNLFVRRPSEDALLGDETAGPVETPISSAAAIKEELKLSQTSQEPAYEGPKWTCPRCLCDNPFPHAKCGMCGNKRPEDYMDQPPPKPTNVSDSDSDEEQQAPPAKFNGSNGGEVVKSEKGFWKCPRCFVENTAANPTCEMCGHKRDLFATKVVPNQRKPPPASPTSSPMLVRTSSGRIWPRVRTNSENSIPALPDLDRDQTESTKEHIPESIVERVKVEEVKALKDEDLSSLVAAMASEFLDEAPKPAPRSSSAGASSAPSPAIRRLPVVKPLAVANDADTLLTEIAALTGAVVVGSPNRERSGSRTTPLRATVVVPQVLDNSPSQTGSPGVVRSASPAPSTEILDKITDSMPKGSPKAEVKALKNEEIHAKAQEMISQGVEKAIVAAFILQQKTLQSQLVPTSPVAPKPNPGPPTAPSALSNAEIQVKAHDMIAQGIDKGIIADFIQRQRDLQIQDENQRLFQRQLQLSQGNLIPGIVPAPYQSHSGSGMPVCFACRLEITDYSNGMNFDNRFYHSSCVICADCFKDIRDGFLPIADQIFCSSCYHKRLQ